MQALELNGWVWTPFGPWYLLSDAAESISPISVVVFLIITISFKRLVKPNIAACSDTVNNEPISSDEYTPVGVFQPTRKIAYGFALMTLASSVAFSTQTKIDSNSTEIGDFKGLFQEAWKPGMLGLTRIR